MQRCHLREWVRSVDVGPRRQKTSDLVDVGLASRVSQRFVVGGLEQSWDPHATDAPTSRFHRHVTLPYYLSHPRLVVQLSVAWKHKDARVQR
eukprot:CAMPEP_0175964756 /NCGR_PEP_ID=MMETSP0108-20121206/37724_1 /TAXON_ID=195067 ORGANISM="Goniomonas pacifica, Strain CCMP1869" /NCGR_SAMPLE_ID=MMETSP0108 /ASSEMBLY_ACC=CAM_ASM_000204 /LENGTH=91 /DNA_ID=CAMNT_0017292745 /DNA_START=465 /DNA_END=740 /DNA_ORIENTATION=+